MNPRLDRLIRKHGLSKLRETIGALAGEAIRLRTRKISRPGTIRRGATKFGGAPDVPKGFRWPMRGKRPLTFIAQIDVAAFKKLATWPDSGRLLFFHDAQKQPWGFDPKDRRGSTVVYVPLSAGTLRPMPTPGNRRRPPYEGGQIPECSVAVSKVTTIPPPENPAMAAILTNEKLALAYYELYREFWPESDDPNHQFLGWPQVVQSDMEAECQLAFHGINCGGTDDDAESPRARVLTSAASQWQLLLQVGSDDNLGIMWGDLGKIYFYVTGQSRATLSFDETWTVLQCS